MGNKRKFIYWILLIGWMSFIAIMSHQPADISDSQSMGIIARIEEIGLDLNMIFGDRTNFMLRKFAHFLEYMILAIFMSNVMNIYFDRKKSIIVTMSLVFLYACSDEIHQLFVEGREGAVRDVLIDTAGGITTIIIKLVYEMGSNKR
ncbi:MAG: VanZ family protein [Clostridium butyricum]|nr:VanZ family protein [Clostridium butyricum]